MIFVSTGSIGKHTQAPTVSSKAADFQSVEDIGASSGINLVKLHGRFQMPWFIAHLSHVAHL